MMNNTGINYYLYLLDYNNIPDFLLKYLKCPSLNRLKSIGYFCGMDYASKEIYQFRELITRYDHSLTVALLVYKLTKDKKMTLAGLFHDIATPCFSHVIDYMNQDYEKQESTEEYTSIIMNRDKKLLEYLECDKIKLEDILNFKKYTIVDNERPKLCADRLDGLILTGYSWTKEINLWDIKQIIDNIKIYINEFNEEEIGFCDELIYKRVIQISKNIDIECHSDYDNYMMNLLSEITKRLIENEFITYESLYFLNESQLFNILNNINDKKIKELVNEFYHIKKEDIKHINLGNIKRRTLNPLLNGKRYN